MELVKTASNLGLIAAVLVVLLPHCYFRFLNRLPQHATEEPYFLLKDLWSEDELSNLRQLLKDIRKFHTAAQDMTNDHYEVRVPMNPDGTCPHLYLVPDPDAGEKTVCILPGRIDMFRHYSKTGGKYGAKVLEKSGIYSGTFFLDLNILMLFPGTC